MLTECSVGQPVIADYNPPPTTRKRGSLPDQATRLAIAAAHIRAIDPMALILAPVITAPSTSATGNDPRCPNPQNPFGAVAQVKNGARPPAYNGCGSTNSPVPNLVFVTCCDNHDLCYDDCGEDFDTCNSNFRTCNHAQCASHFGGFFEGLELWGCNLLADFYADVVSGFFGKEAFDSANGDRCECDCPEYTSNCGNTCRGTVNDPLNCGGCGTSVRPESYV